MEQNNSNFQDYQNAPENPYTHYYHEYIVDPGEVRTEVTKPRRISSIILCALSTMVLFGTSVMWLVIYWMSINTEYSFELSPGVSIVPMTMLFLYCMLGSLAPAIVAKVINRKSKWAVINFICIGILFVAVIVASFFMPKLVRNSASGSSGIKGEWNRDVSELLEDYDFDVEDLNEDYRCVQDGTYEVWIYVSSEADDDQISDIDHFLNGLQDLGLTSKYNLTIKVHPCYYEPGDDDSFVYARRYKFDSDSTSYREISIKYHLLEDLDDAEREQGHVPDELEEGDLLIVVE